jgi:WD40 repeat protein
MVRKTFFHNLAQSLDLKVKITTSEVFNNCVKWSNDDDNHVIVGNYNGAVRIYDVRVKNAPILTLQEPQRNSKIFALSALKNSILYGGEDCKVHSISMK